VDEINKKKLLKILKAAKMENPETPEVSTSELEDKLNMEDHELESYIRDLEYRGYITYQGSKTFNGQDISITPKGEKNI
jgi:DNA-binding MarR family transcriptional regulator